jgi:Flp pilus assembly protein TadG
MFMRFSRKALAGKNFYRQTAGNVALMTAVSLPIVVGLAGGTMDFITASKHHYNLQAIADSAAIAAAREVSLANTNNGQIAEVAKATAVSTSQLNGNNIGIDRVAVNVSADRSSIRVTVLSNWKPVFAAMFSNSIETVSAQATANVIGSGNICIMSLNPVNPRGILLTRKAAVVGKRCGIFSTSVHRRSLVVRAGGLLKAGFICSQGGAIGWKSARIVPTPITDCPSPGNPLADRPMPKVGACDYNDKVVRRSHEVLQPGVYCGGLVIAKNSNPVLEPGVYIIKDGELVVKNNSVLRGNGVGFFLTGTKASFKFLKKTEIDLKAPTKGIMAGILVYQDPEIPKVELDDYIPTRNVIRSQNAHTLEGTIYLPRGGLFVEGEGEIAGSSAYTAIVADRVRVKEGPKLILNSDYKSTDVPVPEGIAGGKVVLAK